MSFDDQEYQEWSPVAHCLCREVRRKTGVVQQDVDLSKLCVSIALSGVDVREGFHELKPEREMAVQGEERPTVEQVSQQSCLRTLRSEHWL